MKDILAKSVELSYIKRYDHDCVDISEDLKLNHLENCIADVLKNLKMSTARKTKYIQKSYKLTVWRHYGFSYIVMKTLRTHDNKYTSKCILQTERGKEKLKGFYFN